MCVRNGIASDLLPAPYSARSRVHEYGGGCYNIDLDFVYFVNDSDQQIYRLRGDTVRQVTSEPDSRFADIEIDTTRRRLIAVRETHLERQVVNSLVSISSDDGHISVLAQGQDFYASPRLNNMADRLCWQSWNHPDMPWDANQLWVADIDTDGQVNDPKAVIDDRNTSVFQPLWSPTGQLYFIADSTGWWHLYRLTASGSIQQLTFGEKEFGLPQWVFAQTSYAFLNAQQILCRYQSEGRTTLARLSLDTLELTAVETHWNEIHAIVTEADDIAMIAASGTRFPELLRARLVDDRTLSLDESSIKQSCELPLPDSLYSTARTLCFDNRHDMKVYANYYPPLNPAYDTEFNNATSSEEAPPLIVICHGGPTGQNSLALDPKKQFWTSRGFALLDVNYSGSTGFGRGYRERLDTNWGILDAEDCCDAARYAVSEQLADPDRLIIRGSSAGGYTVLAALTFHDVFAAGASYYGISELRSLAEDTHKFESRYLDRLIGPYPECEAVYQARSPIEHTDQLHCPVIFFQGIDDRVVPKEQAEMMFAALDQKQVTVAAQYFAGEQHGFRKAETIIETLENELAFYRLVFGMKPRSAIRFRGELTLRNAPL